MPPRPPPSPGVLTILCSIAGVAALWLSHAVDQVARGLVGGLLGVPFLGLELSAANHYLVIAHQGSSASLGPGGLILMELTGAACIIVLAWVLYAIVRVMHVPGWLRGLALAWVTIGLLWLPAALASSVLPQGAGPVHELYARLGMPMAGLWTALALALLIMVLAVRVISRCAVDIGRAWMRADGIEFRRRLVRVTAGWPACISLILLSFGIGWAATPWALAFPLAALVALQAQTR